MSQDSRTKPFWGDDVPLSNNSGAAAAAINAVSLPLSEPPTALPSLHLQPWPPLPIAQSWPGIWGPAYISWACSYIDKNPAPGCRESGDQLLRNKKNQDSLLHWDPVSAVMTGTGPSPHRHGHQ